MTSFQDFSLPQPLLAALQRMEFHTPTPVQTQAIPLILSGRDILASAQTGTGKTGAFAIPLVAKLMEHIHQGALIVTPTRELAVQVHAVFTKLVGEKGKIRTALLVGGEPMFKQIKMLRFSPRIVVGTPGRINDHLKRGLLNLSQTQYLVLDETDRMLDMGFGIQIDQILPHLPQNRQTLFFSATLPGNIVKLANKLLDDPERIQVGEVNTVAPKIQQENITTTEPQKYADLLNQLKGRDDHMVIFVNTRHGAERLSKKLQDGEFRAESLHGNLKQRQRERVIGAFRSKKFQILVATDVAARGLDIPHIRYVINYELPQCPEDYIHRIGRTGRADASGAAINFLTPKDRGKWFAIQRLMNPGENHNDNRFSSRSSQPRSSRPFRQDEGGRGGDRRSKGAFGPSFKDEGGRGGDRRSKGASGPSFKDEGGRGGDRRSKGASGPSFKDEGGRGGDRRSKGASGLAFKDEGGRGGDRRSKGASGSSFKDEGGRGGDRRSKGASGSSFKDEGNRNSRSKSAGGPAFKAKAKPKVRAGKGR